MDAICSAAIDRMIDSAPASTRWILPLSGGYDSRMIASYLYRKGITNVLCYTYGRPDNPEAQISSKAAEALGFQWHFVEYNEELCFKHTQSDEMKAYYCQVGNGASLPHIQDYFAVAELKSRGVLREGDIFVPGHNGSFTPQPARKNQPVSNSLLKYIIKKHSLIWTDWYLHSCIRKRITEVLAEIHDPSAADTAHMNDGFTWQERQAKYITNSVRVYEFFGYQWRMPLWDNELTDFFETQPTELRVGRRFFIDAFKTILGEESVSGLAKIKEIYTKPTTRHLLPGALRKAIRSLIPPYLLYLYRKLQTDPPMRHALGLESWYGESTRVCDVLSDVCRKDPMLWKYLRWHWNKPTITTYAISIQAAQVAEYLLKKYEDA